MWICLPFVPRTQSQRRWFGRHCLGRGCDIGFVTSGIRENLTWLCRATMRWFLLTAVFGTHTRGVHTLGFLRAIRIFGERSLSGIGSGISGWFHIIGMPAGGSVWCGNVRFAERGLEKRLRRWRKTLCAGSRNRRIFFWKSRTPFYRRRKIRKIWPRSGNRPQRMDARKSPEQKCPKMVYLSRACPHRIKRFYHKRNSPLRSQTRQWFYQPPASRHQQKL